ncbi:2-phospho-L-lactate guanylyltransferase [Limimaricola sp. G21655-S1]|uniref:2-phospho-L-lactate guanylyltransferase n=1 Tax=Limimaricola sp. G21655-S1 TaxID=3014768 RepID=UPI0022AE8145|nr:2-phospho-L-lactate guanylyltransferase [Limimaricola sp. G21655-S1]MCZ4262376.1 2-phospho-L-lactate guanylyltransferase [Limimaricola sp. G21655-S1]
MSGTAKRLVAIPMKDPRDAKTRLGLALSPEQRGDLALILFRATVTRLREAVEGLECQVDLAAVSASPIIRDVAETLGLTVIDDGGAPSLSLALEAAADWAARHGYGALCILPGDLADPDPVDLAWLLDHPLEGGTAVICPAKDLGTNALMVPLPRPFAFAYGAKSTIRHRRAAEAAGLTPVMMPLGSLRVDVDTVEDLHHLPSGHLRRTRQEHAQ